MSCSAISTTTLSSDKWGSEVGLFTFSTPSLRGHPIIDDLINFEPSSTRFCTIVSAPLFGVTNRKERNTVVYGLPDHELDDLPLSMQLVSNSFPTLTPATRALDIVNIVLVTVQIRKLAPLIVVPCLWIYVSDYG